MLWAAIKASIDGTNQDSLHQYQSKHYLRGCRCGVMEMCVRWLVVLKDSYPK